MAQQRQSVFQQFEAVDGILRQPLPAGDELGCLPGENKIFAGLFAPRAHRFRRWRTIKYAVEFGRTKLAAVILKLVLEWHALAKKRSAPGSVVPSRRADENSRHGRITTSEPCFCSRCHHRIFKG